VCVCVCVPVCTCVGVCLHREECNGEASLGEYDAESDAA